jgi:hypothetical protein
MMILERPWYGCTAEQALQFCKFIVQFDPLADNNWLDPTGEG